MVRVRVPGDKSISHRALILATLAGGESRIRGILRGHDTESTASVLRALGSRLPALGPGDEVRVGGLGLRGLRAPDSPLDCGNSGTTARLMLGVLAAQPFAADVTGDASLRRRPMRRVTGPLSQMGAAFEERGEEGRLPLRVRGGGLRPLEHASPRPSAQVKSAVLLAGLCAGVAVRVREPVLSRDHTERMLRAMGVAVNTARQDDGFVIGLEPAPSLDPLDVDVAGDFSSAAFFLALGLLAAEEPLRIEAVGVNPTRTGLLRVLRRMGATVTESEAGHRGGEPVAHLEVRRAELRGTVVEPDELPSLIDEVPVLAVLAARAEGETWIRGAGELRVKESDRLAVLAENLQRLGVAVEELPDGLRIRGSARRLQGAVRTDGDHRIAMAFGVLGAATGGGVEVDDPAAAAVSFPGFWERLAETAAALGPG